MSCAPGRRCCRARRCCAPISGFGCRLVSSAGGVRHTLLFDTGPEGAIFIRNCTNLGVALGEVEAIAVSHGHWDHMAALPATLAAIREQGGKATVHVNPGMFDERAIRLASGTVVPAARVPSPAEMAALGAAVVNDPAARLLLGGHFYYSGEIPRVSAFEKGRVDHLSRTGPDAAWQPDPLLLDERMLVVHVRDLGLVVVSSCSHAGIVNVCTEVGRLFPDIPIHCVIGGLHLGGVMERSSPTRSRGCGPFAITHIITGHCTGWRALHALANAFGERSANRRSAPHTLLPLEAAGAMEGEAPAAGDDRHRLSGQRQDHAVNHILAQQQGSRSRSWSTRSATSRSTMI